MKGCPHCGKALYPVKNEDGSLNWKNILHIDWMVVGIVLGIVLLLFGFNQIQQQCYQLLEDPCSAAEKANCMVGGDIVEGYGVEVNFSLDELPAIGDS